MSPSLPPFAKSSDLENAVAHIMTKLQQNEGALRIGIDREAATRAAKGAAVEVGDHRLPLADCDFAPEGDWHGVAAFFIDAEDPDAALDELEVTLLCSAYDKDSMAKTVLKAGRALGLSLKDEPEDRHTYFDLDAEGVELWVSLGDRVVLISANPSED